MYGPMTVRRNDLKLLTKSRILRTLEELQEENAVKMVAFGDSIYPTSRFIKSYVNDFYDDNELDELVNLHNAAMKSIRIAIEWNYATTSNIFQYAKNTKKLKLLGSRSVTKIYTVCTLLRNCHVCCYGSQASEYFDVIPPTLRSYLLQE